MLRIGVHRCSKPKPGMVSSTHLSILTVPCWCSTQGPLFAVTLTLHNWPDDLQNETQVSLFRIPASADINIPLGHDTMRYWQVLFMCNSVKGLVFFPCSDSLSLDRTRPFNSQLVLHPDQAVEIWYWQTQLSQSIKLIMLKWHGCVGGASMSVLKTSAMGASLPLSYAVCPANDFSLGSIWPFHKDCLSWMSIYEVGHWYRYFVNRLGCFWRLVVPKKETQTSNYLSAEFPKNILKDVHRPQNQSDLPKDLSLFSPD